MALSPRQELLYEDIVNIFRPATALTAGGVPTTGAEHYTLIASSVRCYIHRNPDTDTATVAGRFDRKMIYTFDILHFDRDQEIGADYWVKCVTLNGDGTQAKHYGRYWRCLGVPRSFPSRANREMGVQEVVASGEKTPPPGVS